MDAYYKAQKKFFTQGYSRPAVEAKESENDILTDEINRQVFTRDNNRAVLK